MPATVVGAPDQRLVGTKFGHRTLTNETSQNVQDFDVEQLGRVELGASSNQARHGVFAGVRVEEHLHHH